MSLKDHQFLFVIVQRYPCPPPALLLSFNKMLAHKHSVCRISVHFCFDAGVNPSKKTIRVGV